MINVLVIFGAAVAWGALHSVLASCAARQQLERVLGRWHRLVYNAVAGVTFLPLLALVPMLPDRILYLVPAPWRWGMIAVQLFAAVLAGLALWQTGGLRFLGLQQLLQSEPLSPNRLQVTGFYIPVRHPIYFFSLIFLWFSPVMTRNQMALYAVFSLYFYVGAIFEERKLVRQFGSVYRAYRQLVPMLVPWKPALWAKLRSGEEFTTYLEDYPA